MIVLADFKTQQPGLSKKNSSLTQLPVMDAGDMRTCVGVRSDYGDQRQSLLDTDQTDPLAPQNISGLPKHNYHEVPVVAA